MEIGIRHWVVLSIAGGICIWLAVQPPLNAQQRPRSNSAPATPVTKVQDLEQKTKEDTMDDVQKLEVIRQQLKDKLEKPRLKHYTSIVDTIKY